jgi:Xaa-Pro aminopeptidase
MTKERINALRSSLIDKKLDAFLISQPENRRYMSGFTGSAGFLFITSDKAILATDFRYTEQAGRQSRDFGIIQISGAMNTWLPDILRNLQCKSIGFEADDLTVSAHRRLLETASQVDNIDVDFIATQGFVEPLRQLKEGSEVTDLQASIDASDAAMNAITAILKPGMTEKEVGWKLEQSMRDFGAEGPSFETIVASGPNAALPHHRPSDRDIRVGEPIVIDMGALVNGYCSDLTRTVILGDPDDKFSEIYDIVLTAQLAAINTVVEGMTGGEVDALSRNIIEQAGYGDKFGHALGHGVGLAVHEAPRVGKGVEDQIKDGMVFTIEPGIYISGWGGVRIEDIVILEQQKARVLSHANKRERLGV